MWNFGYINQNNAAQLVFEALNDLSIVYDSGVAVVPTTQTH